MLGRYPSGRSGKLRPEPRILPRVSALRVPAANAKTKAFVHRVHSRTRERKLPLALLPGGLWTCGREGEYFPLQNPQQKPQLKPQTFQKQNWKQKAKKRATSKIGTVRKLRVVS